MRRITGINSIPSQQLLLRSETGDRIQFAFNFRPAIMKWYMDVQYRNFTLNGYRVSAGPNIVQKYFYSLKWGLFVEVIDGFEPFMINDFESGRVNLYILSETECREIMQAYQELTDEI